MAEVKSAQEVQENKEIVRAYRKMVKGIKSDMTKDDKKDIRDAFQMAVDAHNGQRRKSGEPYIFHPIEVARICAEEIGLGPTAIIGALLHDVVEDTEVTLEDIEGRFGKKISVIVDGLTKLDNIYDVESPQAENFKKVLMTLAIDVRVSFIKLADRLHNMRTISSMPKHKQLKIASETSFIYSPLAHRLGLYKFRTEMQDMIMKIMEPENYLGVAAKLKETKRGRTKYINEFTKPITDELEESGIKYRISGRPKSISSIWNKIQTKKVPFEEIYDLFAVRIILDVVPKMEKRKCWEAYSIVTDVYQPIPERLKDWITSPKANGYESLHTTVVGPKGRYVEVQIRTERMDEISEKGFAAHWKYKGVNTHDDVFDRWLENVRTILDSQKQAGGLEFVNDFKSQLFTEEVYVFTPNGDMKLLPLGATALDFAFHIHSDIGYHCTSVKANSKLVPMNYALKNGDQLSIVTSKSQRPSEAWLKMCITGKAKAKIRQAMKEERRQKGEVGKESLQRKFNNYFKIPFEESNIDVVMKHFGLTSHVDLYFAISVGDIDLTRDLKSLVVEGNKLMIEEEPAVEVPKVAPVMPTIIPTQSRDKLNLLINGEDASMYNYMMATCCNPVQGDAIFGYTTSQNELKIHRNSCPNAQNLMVSYGYRVLKAEWGANINSSFIAKVKVVGVDDIGIVQSISNVLTNVLRVNMRSIQMDGANGYFEGKLSIVVNNTDQLNLIMKTLNDIKGISDVYRED